MKILILFFSFLTNASDADVLLQKCKQDPALKNSRNRNQVCQCYQRNIVAEMSPQHMEILVKHHQGRSIDQELREVEGATVLLDFIRDLKAECSKNPTFVNPPETALLQGETPEIDTTPAKPAKPTKKKTK